MCLGVPGKVLTIEENAQGMAMGVVTSCQARHAAMKKTAPIWLPSATRRLSSPPRWVIQRRVRNPASP